LWLHGYFWVHFRKTGLRYEKCDLGRNFMRIEKFFKENKQFLGFFFAFRDTAYPYFGKKIPFLCPLWFR